MPVANQIETQNIGGVTYYKGDDGKFYDYKGIPAPGQDPQDMSGGSQFEQGVTATDPISGYVSNYNPLQYATAGTTQQLGQDLGLPTGETHMEFSDASAPQRNVGGLNAGLVQDTINRYGPATPGSLSEYLIKRDLPGNQGQQDYTSYNSYANSAPVKAAVAQAQTAPGATKANPVPAGTGAPTYTGGIGQGTPGKGFGAPAGSSPVTPGTGNPIPYGGGAWNTPAPSTAPPPGGGQLPPRPPGSTLPPPPGTTAPPPGSTAQPPPYHDPPYQRTPVQGPGIPGATGPAQAPIGGYQTRTNPAKFTSGGNEPYNPYPAGVNPIYSQQQTPEGENKGEGLQFKTENDRALALQRGEQLNSDLTNYTDQQYGEAGNFSDLQGAAYQGIASGQGGYSGDEKNAILRQDELSSLQQTPEEANQNYLSTDEQKGIMGDAGAAYHQLGKDEAGVDLASNNRDQYARGEFNSGRDAVNSSLAAQDTGVRGAVDKQRELANATLVGEANNARKYLDPNALNTSAEYNNAYNFGGRDMQDIVDKAGRTVGQGAAANEDRLLQDANAQGNTSPLALQAARNRIQQTGQVGSADAMTDARINAKQLQLQTAQNKENTRLGAAQSYANLGTGTELNLGQDAMDMQNTLGAAQIGAESYLGDQHVKAQQSLGQQGTQLEKDIGQSHIDIGTKGAEMNLAAGQAADAANSARAGQVATNRQATSVGNQTTQYNRGKAAYDTESAANKDFATTRLGQEAEYRKTLADRQSQAAQGAQVGNAQRAGVYGTQTGAVNAAEGNAIVNYKVPSATEKILGGIASVVAGADGLVTPGPRRALVGERGPELEVDLAKLPHYSSGYDPTDGSDEYGTAQGYTTGSGETETEGNALPGGTMTQNHPNTLWQRLANAATEKYGYQPYKAEQADEAPYQSPIGKKKSGGGLIGKMLTAGAFAEGGVVNAQQEQVAPGISYLDHPQVKTLGENGPTAIVPLTRRPGNKLNVEDIPRLAQQYQHGSYGAPNYAR